MRKLNLSPNTMFTLLIAMIVCAIFLARSIPSINEPYPGKMETIAEDGSIGSLYIENEQAEELGLLYSGTFAPPTSIIIHGEGDEDICVLDWGTGKLEFRGRMSSSARSFFKYFLKPHVDSYIDQQLSEFVDQKLEEGRKKENPVINIEFVSEDYGREIKSYLIRVVVNSDEKGIIYFDEDNHIQFRGDREGFEYFLLRGLRQHGYGKNSLLHQEWWQRQEEK